MPQSIRLALAQINCTVGDLEGNAAKILEYSRKAAGLGAQIVAFPELALTGYPPEDLLLKPAFIKDNLRKIEELGRQISGIAAVVGFVDRGNKGIYNAAAVIYDGRIKGRYYKMLLPNYGVFDEKRYFLAGEEAAVFRFGEIIFAVNICEDIWHQAGPVKPQAKSGARLIININASPYHAARAREREAVVCLRAKENRATITYTNLVGGQDELVFDGQSMIVDRKGKVIARAAALQEDLLVSDIEIPSTKIKRQKKAVLISPRIELKKKAALPQSKNFPLQPAEEIYRALALGLHDYVVKNGFQQTVVGLSGGIDSALVAVLAADALSKDNIIGVFMPSPYSSRESREDAAQLAGNLGIRFMEIPIEKIFKVYLEVFTPHFSGLPADITEENLQARIRGNILMALSNKFGWLVLTTGNKSEMSTGYATLYGDMAGGFAVLKDVPKCLVYKLAEYRNSLGAVIPGRILSREPSAELRPGQKDRDSLPVYQELDPILKAYVEEDKDFARIIAAGFDRATVAKVIKMVDRSEYKRRQSPPGIKITYKSFGKDRRMPITNKYKPAY